MSLSQNSEILILNVVEEQVVGCSHVENELIDNNINGYQQVLAIV